MGTHSRTMMILTDGNQIMRKLIILCLLVAIGAVAMIHRADAGTNISQRHGYGPNYYPGQGRDVAFMRRDQDFPAY